MKHTTLATLLLFAFFGHASAQTAEPQDWSGVRQQILTARELKAADACATDAANKKINEAVKVAGRLFKREVTEDEALEIAGRELGLITGNPVTRLLERTQQMAADARQMINFSKILGSCMALLLIACLSRIFGERIKKTITALIDWIRETFGDLWNSLIRFLKKFKHVWYHLVAPLLLIFKPLYPVWLYGTAHEGIAAAAAGFAAYSLYVALDWLMKDIDEMPATRVYLWSLAMVFGFISFFFGSVVVGTGAGLVVMIAVGAHLWEQKWLRIIALEERTPHVGVFVGFLSIPVLIVGHDWYSTSTWYGLTFVSLFAPMLVLPAYFLMGVWNNEHQNERTWERREKDHVYFLLTVAIVMLLGFRWHNHMRSYSALLLLAFFAWWNVQFVKVWRKSWENRTPPRELMFRHVGALYSSLGLALAGFIYLKYELVLRAYEYFR
ncbi:MAG TPA: hypothetical protein VEA59_06020 [Patescibacteria group bacterium]|nr:hypothetical protein [Patescibacteria group bacterium]